MLGIQVQMMFEQMTAVPGVQSGKKRPIAVTRETYWPILPNMPTTAESAYASFEVLNWQGIIGPAEFSTDLVKLLNTAGSKALPDRDLREEMLAQGNEAAGGTPQSFAGLIKAEMPHWAKWSRMRRASRNERLRFGIWRISHEERSISERC